MKSMRELIQITEATRQDDFQRVERDPQTPDMWDEYLPAKQAKQALRSQNKKAIKLIMRKLQNPAVDDVREAIVDIMYDNWQTDDPENGVPHRAYYEMIDYIGSLYGDMGKLAVMLSNYNGQVNNGGHQQYFDNGYASGETGWQDRFAGEENLQMHMEMIQLMDKLEMDTGPAGSQAMTVMNEFPRVLGPGHCDQCQGEGIYDCGTCDGSGQIEGEYDDEHEEYGEQEDCPDCDGYGQECDYCHGTGEDENSARVHSHGIDDRWYEINDKFLKEIAPIYEKWYTDLYKSVY